jgi:hypothetical protein
VAVLPRDVERCEPGLALERGVRPSRQQRIDDLGVSMLGRENHGRVALAIASVWVGTGGQESIHYVTPARVRGIHQGGLSNVVLIVDGSAAVEEIGYRLGVSKERHNHERRCSIAWNCVAVRFGHHLDGRTPVGNELEQSRYPIGGLAIWMVTAIEDQATYARDTGDFREELSARFKPLLAGPAHRKDPPIVAEVDV